MHNIMDISEFLNSMHSLRELANRVYPDRYQWACMQEGIKSSVAQDMYAWFKMIVQGNIPYRNNKPLSDNEIARILYFAKKADTLFEEHGKEIIAVILPRSRYGDMYTRVLVVWSPKDSDDICDDEFDLSCVDTYVTIGKMAENGCTIHAILHQVDRIDSSYTNQCMDLEPKERGKKSVSIYDGDVFLAYLDKPDFWSSDAEKCGLYLCCNGTYYKLVYTPGKGYIRHGEPDKDEDFKIDVNDKDAFNSHILTMSHKWQKLGNIHVDTAFLIERNKQ